MQVCSPVPAGCGVLAFAKTNGPERGPRVSFSRPLNHCGIKHFQRLDIASDAARKYRIVRDPLTYHIALVMRKKGRIRERESCAAPCATRCHGQLKDSKQRGRGCWDMGNGCIHDWWRCKVRTQGGDKRCRSFFVPPAVTWEQRLTLRVHDRAQQ